MERFRGIFQVIFGFSLISGLIYVIIGLLTPPSIFYMFFGDMRGGERPLDVYHCDMKQVYSLSQDTLIQKLQEKGVKMRISNRHYGTMVSGEIHNFFCGKDRLDFSFEILPDTIQKKTSFAIANITGKEAKSEQEHSQLEALYCECLKKKLKEVGSD